MSNYWGKQPSSRVIKGQELDWVFRAAMKAHRVSEMPLPG
jgi:hypothetical protein